MLDIFRSDAFSVTTLTDSINKVPYKPGRIGAMGLFAERGITTTSIAIEMKDGRLSLIQTTPRGGPGSVQGQNRRNVRPFLVPHLERDGKVNADQVQNVRAFGSETAIQTVQQVINDELTDLRAAHEVTLEWHRIGAIKGLVLDADASTLYDLFDEFDVTQQTYAMDFSSTEDVRSQAVAVQRLIEDEMGGETVGGFRAFTGSLFFDAMIRAASVKESVKYQDSQLLRTDLRRGFEYGGITWEEYRGGVGGTDFVADDEAYVFPTGSNIFKTYFAPADFFETVNTIGRPMYSKLIYDQRNSHVLVHSQSNPLAINTRPRAVVKLTYSS